MILELLLRCLLFTQQVVTTIHWQILWAKSFCRSMKSLSVMACGCPVHCLPLMAVQQPSWITAQPPGGAIEEKSFRFVSVSVPMNIRFLNSALSNLSNIVPFITTSMIFYDLVFMGMVLKTSPVSLVRGWWICLSCNLLYRERCVKKNQ